MIEARNATSCATRLTRRTHRWMDGSIDRWIRGPADLPIPTYLRNQPLRGWPLPLHAPEPQYPRPGAWG